MELALIVECWEAMGAVRDADVSAEATAYQGLKVKRT